MENETLEEKLVCMFADVGSQIGDVIRCMVDQEIAAHMSRITQLNKLLTDEDCCK
jgi:hypothetical protein